MRTDSAKLDEDRMIALGSSARLEGRLRRIVDRLVFVYGWHEYAAVTLFEKLVHPGMYVVDVGANIGEYTLIAANALVGSGRVLAIEPNDTNLALLRHNIDLNHLTHMVQVLACAAGANEGTAAMYVPENRDDLGSIKNRVGSPQSVRVVRLDDLSTAFDLPTVDLLKIDVEGFETRVLEGALETLRRFHPTVFFELNDYQRRDGHTWSEAIELLQKEGYKTSAIMSCRHGRWTLMDLSSHPPERIQRGNASINAVAIHPSRFKPGGEHLEFLVDIPLAMEANRDPTGSAPSQT